MNFKEILSKEIKIEGVTPEELEKLFTIPPTLQMGDFALPCFSFAKIQKCSPAVIAQNIAKDMQSIEIVDHIDVVNGYLNIFLNKKVATNIILNELLNKQDLCSREIGKGKLFCIDYSSINVAKNPHIGHFSNTVIGASIARLYEKMGYNVKRLNYLGDYGTQFGKLVCAYQKWATKEDVEKRGIEYLQELYIRVNTECETDENLLAECRETFKKMEEKEPEITALFEWFKKLSIEEVKKDVYEPLKITFDDWRGEQYYSQFTPAIFEELDKKHITKISQGATIVDLEEYGLGVAIVKQSNGTTLYLTRDIATAIERYKEYKFDKCIYITGVEQKIHFEQLFKILELMGKEWSKNLIHIANGRLRLPEGKLSSRKGSQALIKDIFVNAINKATELIQSRDTNSTVDKQKAQDIGIGALIFSALKSGVTKDSVFVLEDALNFDGETGPYLMYTHARCASILRKFDKDITKIDAKTISTDDEISWELVSCMNKFNAIVFDAYNNNEPSFVARYLIELATIFNKFYHDNRILGEDETKTLKNVTITYLVEKILKEGLSILGIVAPEEM